MKSIKPILAVVLAILVLSAGVIAQIQSGGFTATSGSTFNFSSASLFNLPGFHATALNTSTQSIATSTSTALTFNSNRSDTSSIHSTSVNPTRFTVPSGLAGTWLAVGQVQFAIPVVGVGNVEAISINVNGSAVQWQVTQPVSTIYGTTIQVVAALPLSVGDYVEFIAFQASGASLSTTANTTLASLQRLAY
jgi:hypothetical protein